MPTVSVLYHAHPYVKGFLHFSGFLKEISSLSYSILPSISLHCPLYFLHSAVAGVMPAEPWFKTVRIAPQPGGLKWIDAATPHPNGMILTKLRFEGDAVSGTITLPDSVSGTFEWKGRKIPLRPGKQNIE